MNLFQNITKRIISSKAEEQPVSIKTQPFYIQTTFILIALFLFFYILYILGDILIPLAFSFLLAVLLNPLVNWMVTKRISKIIAIIIALTITFFVFIGIAYFISTQMAKFADMLPSIKIKLELILKETQNWVMNRIGYPIEKQNNLINKIMENSDGFLGSTIISVFGILSAVILLPIYTFLLLYYKPLLLNFIYESFDDKNGDRVEQVLAQTKGAVQSYVNGLLIESLIVAAMNSAALFALGVPYAILIGSIGALLNMIPYIGGIIAIAIPILLSLATHDGFLTPVLIVVAYSVIQFIDNNILVPRVVSSKVSINALVSVIIVLLGNALWGVSGMFLSIPFIGVLKIIFDRVDSLNSWGKLLGTKMPTHKDPIADHTHEVIEEVKDVTGEGVDEGMEKAKQELKEVHNEELKNLSEKTIKEKVKSTVKDNLTENINEVSSSANDKKEAVS